jgi:ATP/maltotriose-dependent transcriptional regulator MalT
VVAAWVAASAAGQVAWVSLDHGDADRHRFWGLVAAALGIGPAVPTRGNRSATLDALGHALAGRAEPIVLVLDDLHEADPAGWAPTSIACWPRRRQHSGSFS